MDPLSQQADVLGRLWDLRTQILHLQDTLRPASAVEKDVKLDLTRQLDTAFRTVQKEHSALQAKNLTLPFFTADLIDKPTPAAPSTPLAPDSAPASEPVF